MSKKLLIYIISIICAIHTAAAQSRYVFDNMRSDVEKGITEDFATAQNTDTAIWLPRFIACEKALRNEEDYKAYTGSIARIYEAYERMNNINGCQRCIQTLEHLSEKYQDQNPYLQSRILLANSEFRKQRYPQGLNIYQETATYLENKDDNEVLTKLYLQIAIAFGKGNQNNACMKYLQKAVYMVENSLRNPKLHCETYYRTALLYMTTEEYENAKAYLKGALMICEHEHYQKMEAKCRLVFGDYLRKTKHPQLALSYNEYDKCINILTSDYIEYESDNVILLAKAYNGKARTLLEQNLNEEAMTNLNKALNLGITDLVTITDIYMTYGNYYKKLGNQDSAEYYFEMAFNNARMARSHKIWKEASLEMAKIMQSKQDWKKAYSYKSIALECYEMLSQNNNSKALASWEVRSIAENESRIQKKEIEKNRDLIKQRGIILVLAIVVAAVSLISLIATYKLLKKKRKKNQELREKKDELEKTYNQLREQQEELKQQAEVLTRQNSELEKLSLVAKQTDNSIFLSDPEGNIIWLNEAFTRHSGYNIDDYLNSNHNSLLQASSNPYIQELMNQIKVTKQPVTYTSQTNQKSGKKVWIQTTLSPALDEDGNISMFIAVCSDITSLKQAQEKIAMQNKEINDSLEYARKIQDAIQAPKQFVDYVLGEYFEVNLPKNIVSGDFHWVAHKDNKTLFALGDCTGHGIPGGFMSMIEQVMLSSVLQEMEGDFTSAMILNKLRERNIKLLHQRGRAFDSQDGMDASLFVFNRESMMLNYAAGYSIAYLLRFGKPDEATRQVAEYNNCPIIEPDDKDAYLIRLRPNRFPVGGHPKDNIPFNDLYFCVNDGDIVYTSSDGFVDQFGGPNSKKFNTVNFERKILELCHLPMHEQQESFARIFNNWKGINEQTDDVHIFATVLRKNF